MSRSAGVVTATGSVIYPGVWLGKVRKVDDAPSNERTGKLKIEIPDVFGDNIGVDDLPWAYPIFPGFVDPSTQSAAFFAVPPVNARVCVLFERGDMQSPRWFGGWSEKGRLPFQVVYSEGDKFPHIQAWIASSGMMIRFVPGQRMEIVLGESGSFGEGGVFVPDGQHGTFDTMLTLDVRRGVEFRTKLPVNVRTGPANVRMTQVRVRVMPNQVYDEATETWSNAPGSVTPVVETNVYDPAAEMGARIIMEPGKIIGRARHVQGFQG